MATFTQVQRRLPVFYKLYRINGNPIEFLFLASGMFKGGQPRYNTYRLTCNNISLSYNTKIIIAGDTYVIKNFGVDYDPENPYHIASCASLGSQGMAIICRINSNPNVRKKYRFLFFNEQTIVWDTATNTHIVVGSFFTTSNFTLSLIALEPDLPLNVQILDASSSPHPHWTIQQITHLENYENREDYKVVVYPFVNKGVFNPKNAVIPPYNDINYEYYQALPPQSITPVDKFGYPPNFSDFDRLYLFDQKYYPHSYDGQKIAYFNLQGLLKGVFDREDLPDLQNDEKNYTAATNFKAIITPKFYSQKELLVLFSDAFNGRYSPFVASHICAGYNCDFVGVRLFVLNGRLPDPYTDYYYKQIYCKDYFFEKPTAPSNKPIFKAESQLASYYFDGDKFPIKFLSHYGAKYHCSKAADYIYFIARNIITQSTISDFYLKIKKYCENGVVYVQYIPLTASPDYADHASACPPIDEQIVEIKLKNIDLFDPGFSGCNSVYKAEITVSYFDSLTLAYYDILYPLTYLKNETCCQPYQQLLFKNRFGVYETLLFDKKITQTAEVSKEQTLTNKRGFLHPEDPVRDMQDNVSDLYEKIVLVTKNLDKEVIYDLLYSESVYYIDNTTSPATLYPVVLEDKEMIIKGVQNITDQRIIVKRRVK